MPPEHPSPSPARPAETPGLRLHDSVAGRLRGLIDSGTYGAGDRLPSVRNLRREWRVSVSTIIEAYRRLENEGIVEARPQSGFFVLPRPMAVLKPKLRRQDFEPTKVTSRDIADQLLSEQADAGATPLGTSMAPLELLPVAALTRALNAAMRREKGALLYGCTAGDKRLRSAIARRSVSAGCALSPDDLIVTNGCTEAVTLALRVTCKPGDVVAVESPCYYLFLQMLAHLGLKALEIPTDPQAGVSVAALRFALEQKSVQAILLNPSFQNPTGGLVSPEDKRDLAALAAEFEVPLIEDDIYGELGAGDTRPPTIKAFDREGWVILASSFSKTVAPGWRVGWLAAGPRFRESLRHAKQATSLMSPTAPQVALAEFLEEGGMDAHLRRMRRKLAERRRWLREQVLRAFPEGTTITCPQGGYVVWVKLPGGRDSTELYRRALRAGMTIAPGSIFSATGRWNDHIRLGAAFVGPGHEAVVEKLAKVVRETPAAGA